MSREAAIDPAWCAACQRDVTTGGSDHLVPHTAVPGTGMDEWCPGTNRTPHGIAADVAAQQDRDM